MNDDIEQIREQYPPNTRKWGRKRKTVSFVIEPTKLQAMDTAADLLNQSHGEELGYKINRNHILAHLVSTHPVTADIEQALREGEDNDDQGRRIG